MLTGTRIRPANAADVGNGAGPLFDLLTLLERLEVVSWWAARLSDSRSN